jgi:hypothetical protein
MKNYAPTAPPNNWVVASHADIKEKKVNKLNLS